MTGKVGAAGDPDHLFVGDNELAGLMREFDWSTTPLGPPQAWPESLKTSVRIMLTSRQPIWIGWGPELTYLYNTPYKSIIGGRHPWALGKPISVVWREIWSDIGPMLETAMKGDEGTYVEARLLIMERNGYPEETYYTFSYSPIPDAEGVAGGIFCANSDDTERVISERQLALLRELSAGTAGARTPEEVCRKAALALATDSRDLPFAMIYLLDPGSRTARLSARSGISADHPAAPGELSLDAPGTWPLGEAGTRRAPTPVSDLRALFPSDFPSGAWTQPPTDAVILPIEAGGATGTRGFLIAGLNPFRLLDDNYSSFLQLAAGQIAAAIANAQAYEEELRRAEALAEIDRAQTLFFSNASHKFRTPLTLMPGPLEEILAKAGGDVIAANASLIRQAEEREQAEGRFQLLVEGVTDYALYMLDPSGIITNWNTGAERIKGYSAREIIGQHFERFYTPEDRAAGLPARALEQARLNGKFENEGQRVRKDGTRFWASVVINAIRDRKGELVGFAKITRDVTERHQAQEALQRAQEQLMQSQKMEGIGQLTGGVAHDFNNLLTIIIGNLESLERAVERLPTEHAGLLRSIDHAMRGAQRAASLTQHLLAFARRQPLDPKPFDVGRLVTSMSELLRRTLGEQIAIESVLAGGLWRVNVDPNQLEVAILNLAVNARDAMPQGGKLTIETANTYLDETYAATQSEVVPGQYVAISITDTGSGMALEVQRHAFEPFYTTKDIGQGTGLGLSQVYGFVKQSGGHVKIYSEMGQGTTVKLYLPRLHSNDGNDEPENLEQAPRGGSGQTILAVEDDPGVRTYTCGILRELGYVVLEAATGAAGLQMLEKHPEIALLFTDVGLPGGMSGRQLADEARKSRPDLKVLFTTGYARNAIVHDGRLDPGVVLLPKPFSYAGLATKLADILADPPNAKRVLLVEDNELVQELAVEYLEDMGYRPQSASTAVEALSKMRLMNGQVDFAVIDIGLPDRRGDILIGELRTLYPQLPIVIASGDGEAAFHKRLAEDPRIAFLRKPYTQDALRGAIAALLTPPAAS